ncbi:MAG: hypothetical protein COB66_03715 [Coxiella sp. (in: Bacteria)]|nr:MAG: hypothetical protein COB66_03715 [Coxiella sp. (in: g-proteobacteria)]
MSRQDSQAFQNQAAGIFAASQLLHAAALADQNKLATRSAATREVAASTVNAEALDGANAQSNAAQIALKSALMREIQLVANVTETFDATAMLKVSREMTMQASPAQDNSNVAIQERTSLFANSSRPQFTDAKREQDLAATSKAKTNMFNAPEREADALTTNRPGATAAAAA